jgi:2-oxoglutarate dehydrogenase E1 component
VPVRLTGQDSERGTFSSRHAVLHDVTDGRTYASLAHVRDGQATVEIRNSPLSECGVLGFEYGYSLDAPGALVAWEAQFGDFINVAQVYVDQFLASAEAKWRRLSGLVLLLPHGLEGQGPEHSSARIERFLALAAEDNLQLVTPTTPAQYFHALRRQVVRPWRKPLVVMTPKSLLRHPAVVSPLEDLAAGSFRRILPDAATAGGDAAAGVSRVLLCGGKVFYDLDRGRQEHGRKDVAILRLEQLYPLSDEELATALAPYPAAAPLVWVQEEPANMAAVCYLRRRFAEGVPGGHEFRIVSRAPSASPATGSHSSHDLEQRALVDEALGQMG